VTDIQEWVLVPKFPTKSMVDEGAKVVFRTDDCDADDEPYRARWQAIHAYAEMLSAAPPPHLMMLPSTDTRE